MNTLNAEIMNLIIFILVFLILYFNLVDTNQYLKNFIVIIVIGFFGIVDLKYGLLLLILYAIDINKKLDNEGFIMDKIKTGIGNIGKSMSKIGQKPPAVEEGEEEEVKESFVGLKSLSDTINNNETFKTLKKNIKKGARNILKSIQEEETIAKPEGEEEEEDDEYDDDDDIENFGTRKKSQTLEQTLKENFLINQLKKNDHLDAKLENFQGKIENKLQKINKIIEKFKK